MANNGNGAVVADGDGDEVFVDAEGGSGGDADAHMEDAESAGASGGADAAPEGGGGASRSGPGPVRASDDGRPGRGPSGGVGGGAGSGGGSEGGGGDDERRDAATEKRRAIRSILADATLTDLERRLRIQRLMDGSSGSSAGGDDAIVAGGAGTGGGGPGSSSLASSLLSGAGGTSAAGGSSGGAGGGSGDGSRRSEEAVACVHYERRCSVVAPCCGVAYGCRVCHDEMSLSCGPMDRFAVEEVVCKECRERQPSKTNECRACGVTFAEYHCPKCNIWMALSKRPFHCDECGFCRVGGRENFKHCATCCMCVAASVHATHSCMREKYKNNCPVCREDMFSSRQSPQDLPCGHVIHSHCFRNLAGFDYRCPICKKTVLSRATMSAAWRARANDIEMQPMPDDLARVVNILCNDCERRTENLGWHFLGVQCPGCSSFNTVVENVVSGRGLSDRVEGE